jgi:hypothetical protein
MADPLPTRRKVLDVEGEAQVNADGVNRQYELLRCEPGEPVTLRRDPRNPFDPNTILVVSTRGVTVGRLTGQYAAMLAPLLDRDRPYRARLHCLRGGVPDYPNYGARISVAWDGRPELRPIPLDEEQARFRRAILRRAPRWRGLAATKLRRIAAALRA